MSFWERNREILQKHYAGLLEEITAKSSDDESSALAPEDIKIETSSAGDPSLSIKGIFVHSARDPAREGKRLSESAAGTGPIVILGFGLGYSASSAAEMGRPVVIVEKYKELLVKALELRDLSALLSKKIIFVIGGEGGEGVTNALSIADELIPADDDTQKKAPAVIRNRALIGLDEEWYGAVEDRIRTWTMKDDVNSATFKRFGKRWVRNLSRNMSAIRDFPGISRLAGLAADDGAGAPMPVFLAAAGPSLDKAAPLLCDIHARCVVVAVDTSLRFFTKSGVQPDFVLVVDPQFWNSRHLDRCCNGRTALIAESAVYPPVLNLPFKNKFLCGSLFPLGSFIENQVDPKGVLGAGGSVATTAWDFARSLDGGEIWIAGLDLAFPDMKTHFRGALFEDRSNAGSSRFSPAEKWIVRALRDGSPFKARSTGGGQVLTDRRLSLYASWFENRFRMHPQVRNFALFQDGLAIKGLESAKAEDLLALPERRAEIDKRITAAFSQIENNFFSAEETRKRNDRYDKAVSVLIRGLNQIKDAATQGAEIARQSLERKINQEQKNKLLKDLDEITKRIDNSEVKEVAGFLFPREASLDVPPVENEKESDGDPFRAYLKSSLKLFSSLAESAGFNLDRVK